MKFSWKIFFVSFLIIIISFGAGGFALVNSVFTSTLNSKIASVCDSNSYASSSFYAMVTNAEEMGYGSAYITYIINNFSKQLSTGSYDTTAEIGYIDIVDEFDNDTFPERIGINSRNYRIVTDNGKKYLQVVSRITLEIGDYYIQTLTDVTDIYSGRDNYFRTYQIILMCLAFGASLVLVLLSHYLTKPLVRLADTTRQIADGDFSKRAEVKGSKEIYELSQSFNAMAERVENYIAQLKESAQSRDDFVADFTHELKTPLTSVIGYADMLRSYELEAEQRRKCADYIYKEGKRLESLSANLLNIIVLKNNNIALETVSIASLMYDTGNVVEFLLQKYGVTLDEDFENAEIIAEQSLLRTLLYNIIDNACKASENGSKILLSGFCKGSRYKISVTDHGSGIPSDELEKITRPFYMVDKSRSRSMGGAGLGLALCNEIARLHGSELKIESELGKGTTVSFDVALSIGKDGEHIEEK